MTDIETIDQLTATNLQASGTIINQVSTSTIAGITSSASTSTTTTTPSSGSSSSSNSSSNGGGYSY